MKVYDIMHLMTIGKTHCIQKKLEAKQLSFVVLHLVQEIFLGFMEKTEPEKGGGHKQWRILLSNPKNGGRLYGRGCDNSTGPAIWIFEPKFGGSHSILSTTPA